MATPSMLAIFLTKLSRVFERHDPNCNGLLYFNFVGDCLMMIIFILEDGFELSKRQLFVKAVNYHDKIF